MSDTREQTPSERRAKQILESIDSGNWKHGLQQCEKYQKKGDTSDMLKILKARCLLSQPPPLNERGLRDVVALCDRKQPVTSYSELNQLEICLSMAGKKDKISALWDRVIRAKPHDKAFQEQRFWDTTSRLDWLDAQKVANGLQKNFPSNRQYYFWTILMSLFVFCDERSPEDVRQLHGKLAQGYIKRAASLVSPLDGGEVLPDRALQNIDELDLLQRIYAVVGPASGLDKLVNEEKPYLVSRIVGVEDFGKTYAARFTLHALEDAQKWKAVINHCRAAMVKCDDDENMTPIRLMDDSQLWTSLVDATIALDDEGVLASTDRIIQAFLDAKPPSHNALVANLKVLNHRRTRQGSDDVRDDYDDGCEQGFRQTCNRPICFDRLRTFVHQLPPVRQQYFLHDVVKYSQSLPEAKLGYDPQTNALKFRYCFHISTLRNGCSIKETEDFICECIKRYRLSENIPESNVRRCHDAGTLAAMTLVRLSQFGPSTNGDTSDGKTHQRGLHLLQAACLVETMLSSAPNSMEVSLIALRLQLMLGLGSTAIKTFKELNIKNVQHESFSHNFFTRLSTVHPKVIYDSERSSPGFDDLLPNLDAVVRFYATAKQSSVNAVRKGLSEGSYSNVVNTVSNMSTLDNSICKRIYQYEFRRGLRLFGTSGFDKFHNIGSSMSPAVDNRTFEAFPNWEKPDQPAFEEHIRLGPIPKDYWILLEATYDYTFQILSGSWTGSPNLESALRHSLAAAQQDFDSLRAELTPAEALNCPIRLAIAESTAILTFSDFGTQEMFESATQEIYDWLKTTAENYASGTRLRTDASRLNGRLFAPEWNFLHWSFVTLETLQLVALYIKALPSFKKSASAGGGSKNFRKQLKTPDLPTWKNLAAETLEAVRYNARTLKDELSQPGVLGELIDVVLERGEGGEASEVGKEIGELVGEVGLEAFCGSLKDSWDEALDGVLAVKVKV